MSDVALRVTVAMASSRQRQYIFFVRRTQMKSSMHSKLDPCKHLTTYKNVVPVRRKRHGVASSLVSCLKPAPC